MDYKIEVEKNEARCQFNNYNKLTKWHVEDPHTILWDPILQLGVLLEEHIQNDPIGVQQG